MQRHGKQNMFENEALPHLYRNAVSVSASFFIGFAFPSHSRHMEISSIVPTGVAVARATHVDTTPNGTDDPPIQFEGDPVIGLSTNPLIAFQAAGICSSSILLLEIKSQSFPPCGDPSAVQ